MHKYYADSLKLKYFNLLCVQLIIIVGYTLFMFMKINIIKNIICLQKCCFDDLKLCKKKMSVLR